MEEKKKKKQSLIVMKPIYDPVRFDCYKKALLMLEKVSYDEDELNGWNSDLMRFYENYRSSLQELLKPVCICNSEEHFNPEQDRTVVIMPFDDGSGDLYPEYYCRWCRENL